MSREYIVAIVSLRSFWAARKISERRILATFNFSFGVAILITYLSNKYVFASALMVVAVAPWWLLSGAAHLIYLSIM